jgi:hypothetical protein
MAARHEQALKDLYARHETELAAARCAGPAAAAAPAAGAAEA